MLKRAGPSSIRMNGNNLKHWGPGGWFSVTLLTLMISLNPVFRLWQPKVDCVDRKKRKRWGYRCYIPHRLVKFCADSLTQNVPPPVWVRLPPCYGSLRNGMHEERKRSAENTRYSFDSYFLLPDRGPILGTGVRRKPLSQGIQVVMWT